MRAPTPSTSTSDKRSSATTTTGAPTTCKGCGIFNTFISALKTKSGNSSKIYTTAPLVTSTEWRQAVKPISPPPLTWTKPSSK